MGSAEQCGQEREPGLPAVRVVEGRREDLRVVDRCQYVEIPRHWCSSLLSSCSSRSRADRVSVSPLTASPRPAASLHLAKDLAHSDGTIGMDTAEVRLEIVPPNRLGWPRWRSFGELCLLCLAPREFASVA